MYHEKKKKTVRGFSLRLKNYQTSKAPDLAAYKYLSKFWISAVWENHLSYQIWNYTCEPKHNACLPQLNHYVEAIDFWKKNLR